MAWGSEDAILDAPCLVGRSDDESRAKVAAHVSRAPAQRLHQLLCVGTAIVNGVDLSFPLHAEVQADSVKPGNEHNRTSKTKAVLGKLCGLTVGVDEVRTHGRTQQGSVVVLPDVAEHEHVDSILGQLPGLGEQVVLQLVSA